MGWLTQASAAVVPALSAFVAGFYVTVSEELMFRLFAINLLKKFGLPWAGAVVVAAIAWGFGHTGYAVFPMWFRGIEVMALGLILGFAYLRYGIITVLVGHFLMDAFLMVLSYLRHSSALDFYTSLLVLVLPLLWALVAFVLNRSEDERALAAQFNPQQQFNYELLQDISRLKTPAQRQELRQKLLKHGWDPAVVGRAFDSEL